MDGSDGLFEILRYAPEHNWSAYEEALKTNLVFAKIVISRIVYSLGDWMAQNDSVQPSENIALQASTSHGSIVGASPNNTVDMKTQADPIK
ncbi:hypothetical protein V6N11_066284 [Hibiscus sabdariffa]|uniref:Uncharacterized protein n=2 Tax=Hibiscus sabdariffa TaxID=183260 RepID=A0ABR1ZMD4_9ROSI